MPFLDAEYLIPLKKFFMEPYFFVLDEIDSIQSSVIDSHLRIRGTLARITYYFSHPNTPQTNASFVHAIL